MCIQVRLSHSKLTNHDYYFISFCHKELAAIPSLHVAEQRFDPDITAAARQKTWINTTDNWMRLNISHWAFNCCSVSCVCFYFLGGAPLVKKKKKKNQWCSQQEVGRVFFLLLYFFNIKIGLLGRIAFKNVL